ncbi:MAG: homocysteine S-methyltransferase, partial [Actinobacteria bacterium]|nr:homocysteine S-methyltransferase [Actinomycetota bacterium]
MTLPQLTGARPFISDGGLETSLVFQAGIELADFAAFPLLDTDAGRSALAGYFDPYLSIAHRFGTGV